MSLLFESIKLKNWNFHNLNFHNARINKCRKELYSSTKRLDLYEILKVPKYLDNQVYKCRVEYNVEIQKIEFAPYKRKSIKTLQVIEKDIEYNKKFTDRTLLDDLFKERRQSDDILIVKSGFVTDSSYCNICFWDGQNWITPSTPLLEGTRRSYYIYRGFIEEKKIRIDDIHKYEKVSLINAMIDLEELVISTKDIHL